MADEFSFDVFLSHSSRDKDVIRELAERLKRDGLRVWFDQWEIKPGDSIPSKIEEGLEHSRVLVLCMSANAFGSDWSQLEAGTFRFRDPLNKDRRFVPLRLDDAPIKGSLAQFLYINWLLQDREQEYPKLLESCRQLVKPAALEPQVTGEKIAEKAIQLANKYRPEAYAFSPDGKLVLSAENTKTVRLWDVKTGRCLRVFKGHTDSPVWSVVWSANQRRALSSAKDMTVRLWNVETGQCLRVFEAHSGPVKCVGWSTDQRRAISGCWMWGEDNLRL